ncbi:hypothetical protein HYFRA_00010039 [Hymenoscyphus fraxineus]|uniref:UbiA prenyltransferase n=1 Tax=Hymenoscyphus fraxineus TaxID=746836 RepID=A0A9N9KWU8_9HELO|nr:hypothetical protein HYFRA_00010039 [Hymenoscyphus fraxineus]
MECQNQLIKDDIDGIHENEIQVRFLKRIHEKSTYTEKTNRTLWFHLNTLLLFTKSDIKTTLLPHTVFAISLVLHGAHAESILVGDNLKWRFPFMILWIWVHLLIFTIANQRLPACIVEDTANKSWRPLPSHRISVSEALVLLRTIVPIAMGLSILLGGFEASVTLMTFVWLYNDLEGSGAGPCQRNILNGAGYSCFGWGAVSVLVGGSLNGLLLRWLLLLAAVITTTVHAQDFPDVEGDAKSGRETMPLRYGQAVPRYVLSILSIFWSAICLAFWNISSPLVWAAPILIGGTMAVMTAFRWNQWYDIWVWRLWCFWICILYTLPSFA